MLKSRGKLTITIKVKMIVLSIFLLTIPMGILAVTTYQKSTYSLDELGETNLKNSVQFVAEMIAALDVEVKKGNLSLEEAQEKVKVAILGERSADGTRPINKAIDLGKSGYMLIYDQEGNEIAHPNLEGTNAWDAEDANGVKMVQEQIERANNGGGFTYFDWALASDESQIENKVAYSISDPHWGWVLSATAVLKEFNQPADEILTLILVIAAVTTIIGILIIWVFSNKLSTPIENVTERMGNLADGDLSGQPLQIQANDETGKLADAMNQLQNKLSTMINNISKSSKVITNHSEKLTDSAQEVMLGSEQVATTMGELASGSERQADNTNKLSAAMNVFVNKLQETNEYGKLIGQSSHEVISMTNNGSQLMETSTRQMEKINQIVRDTVLKVNDLTTQAQEISQLVIIIRDVSDQTNLLSLNAAIEAARAGEHGKGFAVVANEVRKLAEQVADSVTDITEIVTNIQNEFHNVTESLQSGYREVEEGTNQIYLTKETFNQISSLVSDMVNRINTISTNLTEVAENSQSMNGSIQEIAAISEESAAGIEQTSASSQQTNSSMEEIVVSSERLASLAEELNELIHTFKLK